MRRPHHGNANAFITPTATLLLVLCLWAAFVPAAHAQKISEAISVAVVPFADRAGGSEMTANKATDAAALALDESQEYVVSTRADTRREMQTLGIVASESARHSVSKEQMVRLGEHLRVEKVATGSVDHLSIDKSGRGRCVLTIRLLDIATQEYLDGATSDYTTRALPGWQGEEATVINEALRSAAEQCVRTIQTSRTPRGNIDMVDNTGTIVVNLGARDGVEVGKELLVVRGIWNSGLERVVLQKIGVIEVSAVEINDCRCRLTSGSMPRTADKCYVMYRPSNTIAKAVKRSKLKRTTRVLAALGLVAGIYATATGDDNQSPPGVSVFLTQAAPGSEPRIAVEAEPGNLPGSTKTHAWLVFRGENAGFLSQVDNNNHLVAAVQGGKLANFEDDPTFTVDLEFELEFNYLDNEGEEEDGDVDITYNHLPLVAGRSYYYKLRRIVDPGFVDLPTAASGQVTPPVPVDVSFDIDPPESLGEPSDPAGPVTFFFPGQPETPSDGNSTVDPRAGKTTFRWTPSLGADEYMVFIYDNPQAVGNPVKQSPRLSSTSSTTTMNWALNMTLASDTEYYWFVGARTSGEVAPLVRSNGSRGWVMSEPFRFRTALLPPVNPSVDGGKLQPSDRGGIFGERPLGRRP